MRIDELYSELVEVQKRLFPNSRIEIIKRLSSYIKLNILINDRVFISIRFNAENGRQDFALIHNNQRIFGYDNLKQWHCHPFGKADEHVPCSKPDLQKVFNEMREIIDKISAER